MEINFVKKKKSLTNVIIVKYKIKCLKISAITLNFKAESPIIIENIIKCIGVKIDKSEIYNLSSIATILIKSVRVIYSLLIILTSECIIYEDFVVVRYHKLMLIFFN